MIIYLINKQYKIMSYLEGQSALLLRSTDVFRSSSDEEKKRTKQKTVNGALDIYAKIIDGSDCNDKVLKLLEKSLENVEVSPTHLIEIYSTNEQLEKEQIELLFRKKTNIGKQMSDVTSHALTMLAEEIAGVGSKAWAFRLAAAGWIGYVVKVMS